MDWVWNPPRAAECTWSLCFPSIFFFPLFGYTVSRWHSEAFTWLRLEKASSKYWSKFDYCMLPSNFAADRCVNWGFAFIFLQKQCCLCGLSSFACSGCLCLLIGSLYLLRNQETSVYFQFFHWKTLCWCFNLLVPVLSCGRIGKWLYSSVQPCKANTPSSSAFPLSHLSPLKPSNLIKVTPWSPQQD